MGWESEAMQLAHGFSFPDLYDTAGLQRLDRLFLDELTKADTPLFNRLMSARAAPSALAEKEYSQLIVDLAPHAEDFLGGLFGARAEMLSLAAAHHSLAPLYACKRLFVQRRVAKAIKPEEGVLLSPRPLREELTFAQNVMAWLEIEEAHAAELAEAQEYAAWALYSEEGRHAHRHGVLFKLPRKLDPAHLVPVETVMREGVTMLKLPDSHARLREGFGLTDSGGTLTQALDHAHYCIYCHNQGKDSCSKGFREKDGSFRVNSQEVTLTGCPLGEKISEMNLLKSQGVTVGALAAAVIDNPMLAGTGHRICNDCMKSCIYQKQEPVNIPLVETRTLEDVLSLPYGFEIYSLLTRWNPLNIERPLPRPDTGKRVLVAGLGPAGYTLSHHLLNDGHIVAAIDGLKIEPLPESLQKMKPIRDIHAHFEKLDERVSAGFGGVAEYGITVRWNKNYLRVIRLLLERRANFTLFGGVRFGGQIDYEAAFALGFDHIALCLGAGRPTVLNIENGMARGVRTASDFLMGLQLTGAARADSPANLQLRLPVVVVGGGLTAIDAATEALAYYPVQVEKFLRRYEQTGDPGWSAEEKEIAEEFLSHARALREAAPEQRRHLLQQWGGATIAYRKSLTDAPSYCLNHEEVEKAMEEGIRFAEHLTPLRVELDGWGHARALVCESADGPVTLPARAVLVAAGTSPNTVLSREDPAHFVLDGRYFRAVDEEGNPVTPERVAKPGTPQVLLHVEPDGRAVSFFGDLHPSFAGNVVKAMASAKQGYPVISRMLERVEGRGARGEFLEDLREQFSATVHEVNRLTPTIVEVVVRAPLAAKRFRPGQFFKLQNFETASLTPAMEPLALTGASADPERGLLSLIVLEMGGSSDLCRLLRPGERVMLMGPTGSPTEIPANETVLLAGGGLGNAVLFSIGRALRANGCRVLYFAGYKFRADRYKAEEIEAAADVVVWACDEAPGFIPTRPQDRAYAGNIVMAMGAYAAGELGPVSLPLTAVDRMIVIGSDRMMAAVALARHGVLKPFLNPAHLAVGSINSPMQCMMKEICAQCLQRHVDPATGQSYYVFSCFNQDQPLDHVDFLHLSARLAQNTTQEKLTGQWQRTNPPPMHTQPNG